MDRLRHGFPEDIQLTNQKRLTVASYLVLKQGIDSISWDPVEEVNPIP
jgi:hypothetical protein